MSLSLLQAASDASEHAYNDTFAGWTWKLTGDAVDGRVIGIRVYEGLKAITVNFRGTTDGLDFWKDLEAALPEHEGKLGWVPEGFFRGTEATHRAIMDYISPLVRQGYSVIYGGHSLGAAQACDGAAYAIVSGDFTPHALIALAPARPGRSDLWDILERILHLYLVRNGGEWPDRDPVPDLPGWVQEIDFNITFDVKPPAAHRWPYPVSYHDSALYLQGLAAMPEIIIVE